MTANTNIQKINHRNDCCSGEAVKITRSLLDIQGLTCGAFYGSVSDEGNNDSAGRQPWFKVNGTLNHRKHLMVL